MDRRYYNQMIEFGGSVVYTEPTVPDFHLMVGEAECLSEQSVQVTDVNLLPEYIVEPTKQLYGMSNEDITKAIADGDLSVNDFNFNTAVIGGGGVNYLW